MIFCDMDGVLADFDEACFNKFGVYPHDFQSRKHMWEKIQTVPDYWFEIPKTKGADKLIEYLSQFEFKILTGVPHHGSEKACEEKRRWIEEHFDLDIDIITCFSLDKPVHGKKGDILIDDLERNIKAWEEMGGIGILYDNVEQAIKRLKELGY